jgi:hypothetical protein
MHRPMRFAAFSLLLAESLIFSGCAGSLQSQSPPAKWTNGFWFWGNGWGDLAPVEHVPGALFVQVATFGEPPAFYAAIPDKLPPAREYWLVYRYGKQAIPDEASAPLIASSFARLQLEAGRRNLNVAGLQLDIDSPTNSLPQYAAFLRALRSTLPEGTQLSITCLLDWFRDGTSIGNVIRETDEFVPQFYDITPFNSPAPAIAVTFDPDRWAAVFNRFGKRFRIGISTFGRGQQVNASRGLLSGAGPGAVYGDLAPLDLALNPAFTAETSQNDAGETVLTFHSRDRGETFRFILPSPEGIRSSIAAAHRMGRYCAGIVFFRWPGADEALVMSPDEILSGHPATPAIDPIDGACAAVSCMDLYLTNGGTLNRSPLRYRITASGDLDYFLPDEKMPIRMSGKRDLELAIPAWGGRGRIYLGRAVSLAKVTFSLEKIR